MADLNSIFANLGQNFDADKAGDLDVTIAFELSGEGGGQWYVHVHDGKAKTNEGTTDNPTATIKMDADDYKNLTAGKLNPMTAFLTGKIKVDGDVSVAMQLQSLM